MELLMQFDTKMFEKYFELRKKTDEITAKLTSIHGKNIVCRPGCSSCCVNLTVFPVEFEAISYEMGRDGFDKDSVIFDSGASCGFLKDDLCQIYKYRPVICRTHGIPISFLNDDDPSEPYNAVSFCELNFNEDDLDYESDDDDYEGVRFDENNTLDIDELNRQLFAINIEHCGDPEKRIDLKGLLKK